MRVYYIYIHMCIHIYTDLFVDVHMSICKYTFVLVVKTTILIINSVVVSIVLVLTLTRIRIITTTTTTTTIHSNRSRLLSLALRLVAVHCTGASRALNHMDKVEFRYE